MVIDRLGRGSDEVALGFRFEIALQYAFRLHAGQRRKGGEIPAIGHLLGVAALVIEAGGDEDGAIAGLLHDAVEDAGGEETLTAIRTLFGERVAAIVAGCSEGAPDGLRGPENWRIRKLGYLQALSHASEATLRVALADKLYNARTLVLDLRQHGDTVWERFNRPRADELWFYTELVRVFRGRDLEGRLEVLVDELARVVTEIESSPADALI